MPKDPLRRGDARDQTRRDLERLSHRQPPGLGASIALIGSVGWAIVLLGVGGGLLGHYLDALLHLGIASTLILILLGTGFGTYVAYRSLRGKR